MLENDDKSEAVEGCWRKQVKFSIYCFFSSKRELRIPFHSTIDIELFKTPFWVRYRRPKVLGIWKDLLWMRLYYPWFTGIQSAVSISNVPYTHLTILFDVVAEFIHDKGYLSLYWIKSLLSILLIFSWSWSGAVFSLLYIPSRTIKFEWSKRLNKAGEIPSFIFAWCCHLANPMKNFDLPFSKCKWKLKIFIIPNQSNTCVLFPLKYLIDVSWSFFVNLGCLLFPIAISERLFGLKCGKRMIYLLIVAVLAMIFGNTCWWYSAVLEPLYIYALNI